MSMPTSRVTTHVLDAALGRPAADVPTRLEHLADAGWELVAEGRTNDDGRVPDFGPVDLEPGTYRVWFDSGSYFAATGQNGFYPEVTLTFALTSPEQHYHVPLLLSPYAFSTYRGS